MIRRQFLKRVANGGAAALVAMQAGCSRARERVAFKVTGFTCVTCATGLETLLSRERGVVSVTASYPQGRAHVVFDPQAISAQAIEAKIGEMGFRAHAL